MPLPPIAGSVLVAIPAFGSPELTDAVVDDLLKDTVSLVPDLRVIVVDNGGDYVPARTDDRLGTHRPGTNLRWIGAANWALARAAGTDCSVCIVLNNDTRLSVDFVYWLARSFTDCDDVALAAPCYDDFWLHQRARVIPPVAGQFEGELAYRQVPFCDGTALALSVPVMAEVGGLDTVAFTRHGYGADIDLALRARISGRRCVVTDAAYLSHLRRGTMNQLPQETSERARAEILSGMTGKWGASWRERVGLSDAAFPAHNTGSARSWYA